MTCRTPDELAADMRGRGLSVPEPDHDRLALDLAETKRRLDAGETLDSLSRRDPVALCALAQQRVLTEHEARMLLARLARLEGINDALARERDAERSWARTQAENAEQWGRTCAELGRVISRIAAAAKAQHIEDDHQALVTVVSRLAHSKLPAAKPVDANTAAFVRAAEELAELRELARKVAALVGQPGLEQDPARLGALLVEQVLANNVVRAGDTEPCNCGGTCTRKGAQMVCGQCSRSWRVVEASR
jgi:hypothetical protein